MILIQSVIINENILLNTIKNIGGPGIVSNKTEQFLYENKTWNRLLYFFILENSLLKTRLSKVVDRETDQLFIARAEQFQNEFILKDEYLLDIGNDIKGQEKELQKAFIQKIDPDQETCKMQEKLRNEMFYLEKESTNLKNKLNEYLLGYEG
jgi:hypothetical protein